MEFKQKHIVLRSPQVVVSAVRGAAPRALTGAGPVDVSVHVEELSAGERDRVSHERDVVAVAPVMPMKLIEPRAVNAVDVAVAGDTAWGIRAVGADVSAFDGAGITVAVLDTGIVRSHPAFPPELELTCANFTSEVDGEDQHGHGTHCAGTIFGRAIAGTRIGVAPGVRRALIGKVLGRGGGTSEAIVSAIQWACDQGAHVISMSLGMDYPGMVQALVEQDGLPPALATSRALEGYRANVLLFERLAALVRAREQATVLVAAAGNESRLDLDARYAIGVAPPAVSEGIISVAALGRSPAGLSCAPFSNWGAVVSGPGVDIVSAGPAGGLASMSGTSMAAPHVAGVAALWAQKILSRGPLRSVALSAQLIGHAVFDGLGAGFEPAAVGSGLVQAPGRA